MPAIETLNTAGLMVIEELAIDECNNLTLSVEEGSPAHIYVMEEENAYIVR